MNIGIEPIRSFALTPRRLWLVFIVVFAVSLSFAFYTKQAWEDWYITYRTSKNLATGNGLVYNVGERVHAFTSPLGTLVPALLNYLTGNSSDELVLWLFRIIGCGLLGLSAVVLLKTAQAAGMSGFATTLMIGLFAVDAKIIAFSTNGMETAFMMFFLVSTIYLLSMPHKWFILMLGLSWAGLMWTRPDSFVYIGGLALGYLLFNPASPHFRTRSEMAKKFGLAGVVAATAYMPWVLWTWYYFGTPVPHTVIAKGLFMPKPDIAFIAKLLTFPLHPKLDSPVVDTFMPPIYWLGGWPDGLIYVSTLLGFTGAYYWCLPFARRQGRAVSFALCLGYFYLTYVVPFVGAWYIPSVTLLCIFVLSQIAQQAEDFIRFLKEKFQGRILIISKPLLYACGGATVVASLLLTAAIAYQTRVQQEIIEEGNRKKVGLWLRENAVSAKDRVFVECLGYIGFYSQLKMLDFPGLSSQEVVEVRRRLKTNNFAPLIGSLQPDWLVLRSSEIDAINKQMPLLLSEYYDPVKVFDVSDKVNSHPNLPGRPLLEFDEIFVVYRIRNI